MMKLAFCLYKYFPYGGLQRDFLRITEECLSRGHTVDVYTLSWEGEKPDHLNVITLPKQGWQNHTQNLYFYQTLQTILQTKSYDLVMGFNKIPGLDVYYAADTCFVAKVKRQRPRWYQWLPRFKQHASFEKAVFSKDAATRILLLTKGQQNEFIDLYQTPQERFHILPPVIAKDRVLPHNSDAIRIRMREQWQIPEQHFLLLMVGSGFKTKGLDRTLLALASLPEEVRKRTQLFVIGKDNNKPFFKLASRLNMTSQVSFLGGRNNVPDFLLAADLLLHPAYNENTGTVLLEALIYGLPVLTTDICGYAPYILQARAGKVLPSPFQQTQFNQTLLDMLLSTQRSYWKENAIQFTQQCDLYSMPERAVDFLESVSH